MTLHKAINILGLILFWGWNILAVFLCVFLVGITVLPFVLMAAFSGEIPFSITLCLIILVITPMYAIYFGAKNPDRAVAFFFGVEIPIFILTLFRIFIMRQVTLGSGFLILSAFVAIGVFAWSLRDKRPEQTALNPYLAIGAATVVLITGIYVAILSSLYAFPLLMSFIEGVFSFHWWNDLFHIGFLGLLMISLFLFGAMAFFVFPIYIAAFYPKHWWQTGKRLAAQFSKTKFHAASFVVAAIWLSVFIGTSHQGQADYISRLNDMTTAQKMQEMETPKAVRKTLLNAYLNEYRYLGTQDQARNLVSLYRRNLGSSGMGQAAQNVQSFLLRPLLYRGSSTDKFIAGDLYRELFDSSIQRDEKPTITAALEATYNRDDVVAGLMNVGARNVLISEQNIDITHADNYAIVEIEEVYENLTFERQEIFYYFSLPEDAALTGIWIGQTDDRAKMDKFIVAPRGAAQKVYEEQVRRNIDPALLEQVGPGQYRLRVFPIPVTRRRAQFSVEPRPGVSGRDNFMRVHMRYVVPTSQGGAILPTLLEKRNVDWSRKTLRQINGATPSKTTDWMPEYMSQQTSDSARVMIGMDGQTLSMTSAKDTPILPVGKLAVIIDTSYSLEKHRTDLTKSASDLLALQAGGDATIDYFLSRAGNIAMSKSSTFNTDDLSLFGSLSASEMVAQFQNMDEPSLYDAVILLTDQGQYGLVNQPAISPLDAPLYILHVDTAAPAYDDAILDLIYRTGGGVATSVRDLQKQMTLNTPTRRVSGDRVWTMVDGAVAPTGGVSPDAQALAARQMILMGSFGQKPGAETLDEFHDLAKTYDVVSPYSSMIVLVNERQKEALKQASEADDRFDREGRSGEETLDSPNSPLVSGVPEPHEWLLIILSLLLLLWVWRKRDDWTVQTA